jgi:ATP-dependent Zn protease
MSNISMPNGITKGRAAYHRARKLLEANKEQAIKVAEYLIEHGKIDGVAVERLFPV